MHVVECHDGVQVLGQYHRKSLLSSAPLIPTLSIQREDLEFSVGSKAAVWEVKDPLLAAPNSGGGLDYQEEDTASNYHGGAPASLVGGVSGQQLYSNQGQKMGYGGGGGGRGYPPSDGRY
jgi:hypothetical protein